MADQVQSALFPPWTNTVIRLVLLGVLVSVAGAITMLLLYVRSPFFTNQGEPVVQPVEFDHRHHVGDDGIDCRYCHSSVEKAASAGYPSTEVCMSCHAQVWNQSPLLEPVRRSFFTNRPLEWNRVHDLPGYAYFNHSIHVNQGVGCVECHGRIDEMAEVRRVSPLTMNWCVDCHRDPEPHLRPREFITSMTWKPDDARAAGKRVAQRNRVHTRTSCTTCHR